MQNFEFEVTSKDSGQRLDIYLVKALPKKFSRSFIQRLVGEEKVLLNKGPVKSHHNVKTADKIQIFIPEPTKSEVKAEDIPLDIIYEDKDLLVVNKQAGMVVHPAPGNFSGTLVNALLFHTRDLSGIGGVLRPGIVHRLDKDTSGLLVVAKNDYVHRELAKQFKSHTIKRRYIAFVKGNVELDRGVIELPIGRHPRHRKIMAVRFSKSKEAVTHYCVLKRFKQYSMLELLLKTGRTHQIRTHMDYLGYPLLGDKTYGTNRLFPRQALHAAYLGFYHPTLKRFMEFESKLPADMEKLLAGK